MSYRTTIFIILLALTGTSNAMDEDHMMLTAFDDQTPDLGWRTINDTVMGGRSRGGYRIEEDTLKFRGRTNTNGGGFSSIRTTPMDLNLDDAVGLRMRVRGDGRMYTFRVVTYPNRVTYWAEFPTRAHGKWVEVRIPFSAFWPNWRGSRLRGPALVPTQISSLGIMIYDKKDGPFNLEVDWIKGYTSNLEISQPH